MIPLSLDETTGVVTIVEYGIGDKPNGTQLVQDLIESDFDLKIQRNGRNKNGKAYSTEVIDDSSSGATINMNDEYNATVQVLVEYNDGTRGYETPCIIHSFKS